MTIVLKISDIWRELVYADLDGTCVVLTEDGVERVDPKDITDELIIGPE